jgi:hypothetical protein
MGCGIEGGMRRRAREAHDAHSSEQFLQNEHLSAMVNSIFFDGGALGAAERLDFSGFCPEIRANSRRRSLRETPR